jgi:hypothetical protein
VSDGTHTANIAFLGNYVTASFKLASDGQGGTLVTDPPLTLAESSDTEALGQPGLHTAAMALLTQYVAADFKKDVEGTIEAPSVPLQMQTEQTFLTKPAV